MHASRQVQAEQEAIVAAEGIVLAHERRSLDWMCVSLKIMSCCAWGGMGFSYVRTHVGLAAAKKKAEKDRQKAEAENEKKRKLEEVEEGEDREVAGI